MSHPKAKDMPKGLRTRKSIERARREQLDEAMAVCHEEPAEPDDCLACYAYMVAQERSAQQVPANDPWLPGFYRLEADVNNPGQVDRRRSSWFSRPTIPQGWRFGLRYGLRYDMGPDLAGRIEIVRLVGNRPDNCSSLTFNPPSATRSRHYDLIDAMKPHLVREPDTLDSVLWVVRRRPVEVLRWLLDEGKLDINTIKRMAQERETA